MTPKETIAERAGRVQSLVTEEARRLDPVSRDLLATSLWEGAERAADAVSHAVSRALEAACEVPWGENTDEVFYKALDRVAATVEELTFHVAVASAVSPHGQRGPPMREVDLHNP